MMKKLLSIVLTVLVGLNACVQTKKDSEIQGSVFYLGTYTEGESEGIYKYLLDDEGVIQAKGLMAKADNPSYLAFSKDRKVLFAVDEVNRDSTGEVRSYSVGEDTLQLISVTSSGGAHPCHISVSDDGQIVVANYTGGNLGWLSATKDGLLSNLLSVTQHEGSGPTDRQLVPHAHSAWFVGDEVISCDLGTDELWIYDKLFNLKQKVAMTPGAGPRHLCAHPNGEWLYVVNELNNTVTRVAMEGGQWEAAESISTLPDDFEGDSFCADIHISSDGRFVYASNRGHNSIAIFSVGAVGDLSLLANESVRGDHPRNFVLSPDEKFLLVANKNTQNIVVFNRNAETGLLTFVSEINALSPVCILFE
ncbi:lactonase family protein [Carboxylicivirga caseinilyticus]|uniref:lactonase family protein n=1 Tax=Carboxylicivirga caseinilyticus TaxID=3417572 RepID=UPI003D34A079|nr:lactonase family protein [Marinilabiliaceae bacterium A049]